MILVNEKLECQEILASFVPGAQYPKQNFTNSTNSTGRPRLLQDHSRNETLPEESTVENLHDESGVDG